MQNHKTKMLILLHIAILFCLTGANCFTGTGTSTGDSNFTFIEHIITRYKIYQLFKNYPIDFAKGFLASLNMTEVYPELDECISNGEEIHKSIEKAITDILKFSSVTVIASDMIEVVTSINTRLIVCKEDERYKNLGIAVEDYINVWMYLPNNSKKFYRNYNVSHTDIERLFSEILRIFYDGYEVGKKVGEIMLILSKGSEYNRSGVESYEELMMFHDCLSGIIYEFGVDGNLIGFVYQFITGTSGLGDLFGALSLFFEAKRNEIDFCSKFYSYIRNE